MCVVSHGYGGLVGAGMEVVDGMHAEQSLWGWSHFETCRTVSRVRGDTLMTPPSSCAAFGMVEPELVGLPGKALTRETTIRQSNRIGIRSKGFCKVRSDGTQLH